MTDNHHKKLKIGVKDLIGHQEMEELEQHVKERLVLDKKTVKVLLKGMIYLSAVGQQMAQLAVSFLEYPEITLRQRLEAMELTLKFTREHNKTVENQIALAKVNKVELPKEKPQNKLVDFADEPDTMEPADPLKPVTAPETVE